MRGHETRKNGRSIPRRPIGLEPRRGYTAPRRRHGLVEQEICGQKVDDAVNDGGPSYVLTEHPQMVVGFRPETQQWHSQKHFRPVRMREAFRRTLMKGLRIFNVEANTLEWL
jgi:hypothetical protein